MKKSTLVLLIFCFFQQYTKAHPVGYAGSLSLISYNNHHKGRHIIHYSPAYWWSYGVETITSADKKVILPRLGLLAKRWNSIDNQANLYFFGGRGYIDWKQAQGREKTMHHMGTQLDWESRKYFTMIKYSRYEDSVLVEENYTARLGFAPYLAEYDELNTWFMLQASEQHRLTEQRFSLMPLIRMFYKNILWELGSDNRQNWHFNFSIRQFI